MQFKVGDKVKVKNSYLYKVGISEKTRDLWKNGGVITYIHPDIGIANIEFKIGFTSTLYFKKLKLVVAKNTQLLFDFMES